MAKARSFIPSNWAGYSVAKFVEGCNKKDDDQNCYHPIPGAYICTNPFRHGPSVYQKQKVEADTEQ